MIILKRIFKIFLYILLSTIVIINIFIIFSRVVLKQDFPNIFGFTYFEIASNSMNPELKKGDLVIIDLKYKNYKVGDIITYKDVDFYTTHRVVEINREGVITKGDNNNANDPLINKEKVVGKVIFKIKYIGYLIYLIKKPITIVLGFIIILFYCIKKNN